MRLNKTKMKLVSIIMPAYNEERSIGKTISEIRKTVRKIKNYKFEVVVSNNNSKDHTGEIAKKHGAKVVFEKEQGYGNAYKKGLRNVKGDIIITSDADATYPMYEIPTFIKILDDEGYDFVIGNRFAFLEKGSMSLINYFGNIVLTLTTNLIYGTKIHDSQSGMVAFRRKYLDKINLDLLSSGMPLCQELKLYATCLKMRIKEVPIRYRARIGNSKLRAVKDGFDNLLGLWTFKKKFKKSLRR